MSATRNETKEKILQTALALFAKNGYEAVSVKDIADALAMTKSALYKHYDGKRAIFESIVARMKAEDAARAETYAMPTLPAADDAEAYRRAQTRNLIAYTEAQFRYWTEDSFAAPFRRLLTLEQYRDPEMAALYRQLLCGGPLYYTKDLLRQSTENDIEAEQAALAFFSPVFYLYSYYDSEPDKSAVLPMLRTHLSAFSARLC